MNTPASAVVPSREAVEWLFDIHPIHITPQQIDELQEKSRTLLAEVERLNGELKGWTDCHPTWVGIQLERDQLRATVADQAAALAERDKDAEGCNGLDTVDRVRFYEHDFYMLSNFSAFNLRFASRVFPTSEHAYHWMKFSAWGDPSPMLSKDADSIAYAIKDAESAHQAFKIAEAHKADRRPDWDDVKLDVMRRILRAKVDQHEYVRRKLLATGNRELIEDSWRDDYWGWGPNRDGQNWLGKLWMEIRAALAASVSSASEEGK